MNLNEQVNNLVSRIEALEAHVFWGGLALLISVAIAIFRTHVRIKRDSIIKDQKLEAIEEQLKKKLNKEEQNSSVLHRQFDRFEKMIKDQTAAIDLKFDKIISNLAHEQEKDALNITHQIKELKTNVESLNKTYEKIFVAITEAGVENIAQKKK